MEFMIHLYIFVVKSMNIQIFDNTIIQIAMAGLDLQEKWAFVGSCASYIEGQEVTPSDIDIMTTKAGVEYFASKLTEFITVPLCFDDSKKGSSWYIKFFINGIGVEIMGELVVKGDKDSISVSKEAKTWQFLNHKEFKGLSIPLFPDEFQITTNAMSASREQKVASKAKFMLKRGYKKDLINDLINESHLSAETINRIKKYLPI